jgi:hypothetical protein
MQSACFASLPETGVTRCGRESAQNQFRTLTALFHPGAPRFYLIRLAFVIFFFEPPSFLPAAKMPFKK